MAKFKVGDKVVIKDNFHGHGFQMGDVVVICKFEFGHYMGHKVGDDPEESWAFEDSEIEEYKEEPKMRVTSKVEPMCIYSFDSVEDMRTFLKIADQDGFDVGSCEFGIKEYGLETKFRVNNKKWISYGTWGYDAPRFPEYERVQFKVEEEKEMQKRKFKVGDLVKGNNPKRYFYTNDKMTKGMVIRVYDQDEIRVRILEHSMEGVAGDAYNVDPQYFDFYEESKLVQNEKAKTTVLKLGEYKIVFNGDTTVVTDGSRKGVAKRHPDDEYDAVVGLQVAIERFNGGRKPRIGDKVRVLKVDGKSPHLDHHWNVGDVAEVTQFAYGGKDTSVVCRHIEGSPYAYQTLIAGEYEVLG